jgi:hypothetical protein
MVDRSLAGKIMGGPVQRIKGLVVRTSPLARQATN